MQIPIQHWPKGPWREIATIDPAGVMENLGSRLTFERDFDDLDDFTAAVFTANEMLFALLSYDGIPTGDFTLMAMCDALDDQRSLAAFLIWSGIPEEAVRWRRPIDAG
jgi:hypothetical protein